MSYYSLLSIPAVLGVIGYTTDFLPAKLGVPGTCALILVAFHRRYESRVRDFWWVVGAFAFSIVGDAFLSNKGDDEMLFVYGIAGFFFAHLGYLICGYFCLESQFLSFKFLFNLKVEKYKKDGFS